MDDKPRLSLNELTEMARRPQNTPPPVPPRTGVVDNQSARPTSVETNTHNDVGSTAPPSRMSTVVTSVFILFAVAATLVSLIGVIERRLSELKFESWYEGFCDAEPQKSAAVRNDAERIEWLKWNAKLQPAVDNKLEELGLSGEWYTGWIVHRSATMPQEELFREWEPYRDGTTSFTPGGPSFSSDDTGNNEN